MNTEQSVIELSAESFSKREDRGALEVVPPASATPMSMLAVAVQRGMDVETIKGLMALQREWEANEARKAFVVALSAFKADPPEILKNKQVSFKTNAGMTSYKHATLDEVSDNVGKSLAKYGLSHRWDVEQKEGVVRVTCVLTHSQGHSERVQMEGSPDTSGSKNSIQAIGSTVTYLQRYTLLAATGMAASNQDDDGHAAGELKTLPQEQYNEFVRRIEAETTKPKAQAVWQEAVKVCAALGDVEANNKLRAVLVAHGKFIDQAAKESAK